MPEKQHRPHKEEFNGKGVDFSSYHEYTEVIRH